jgi:hypothetical protein
MICARTGIEVGVGIDLARAAPARPSVVERNDRPGPHQDRGTTGRGIDLDVTVSRSSALVSSPEAAPMPAGQPHVARHGSGGCDRRHQERVTETKGVIDIGHRLFVHR